MDNNNQNYQGYNPQGEGYPVNGQQYNAQQNDPGQYEMQQQYYQQQYEMQQQYYQQQYEMQQAANGQQQYNMQQAGQYAGQPTQQNNQYNQPLNSGNVVVNGGSNAGGNGGGNGGKKKTGLIIGIIAAVVVIVAAIIIAIVIKNKNSDKDDSKDKKTTEAASTEDIATTDDVTDDTTDEVTEAIPEDDWIHISTPEEFQKIADNPDGKYVLDADIDDWMSGNSTSYTPIGTPDMPFTGELDGAGHSISGTLLFTGNDEAWGFFGCNEGYIHDLTLSYVQCVEMDNRYIDAWDTEHTYATLDTDGLPTETTKYYSILCGINRGTIENITSDYGIDMNLYPNDNEKIYIGYVCAYNEGTISGVNLSGSNLYYRTFDKDTAADVGLVCGYQTASAVLDNVTLDYCNIDLDSFGEYVGNVAPTVYLGMLIGEAEGGTTVSNIGNVSGCYVDSDFVLSDADLRMGILIGYVAGDMVLSDINMDDSKVQFDAENDWEGYSPSNNTSVSGGGIIAWADGNVTVSNIQINNSYTHVTRREGGNPESSYAGMIVGYCGGNLAADNVTVEGDSDVHADVEQGDAYAGGLCGYCGGSAAVESSLFSLNLNSWFGGGTLYEANAIGYVGGDAAFNNVEANCGTPEIEGMATSHSFPVTSGRTYYLAALAGCAVGNVTVEGCVIDVEYNLTGGGAILHSAEDTNGFYNNP